MSAFDCERLAQAYSDWIRQGLQVESVGDICILTTPFLDRHRDYIQIYVEKTETGFILSDDGYTLRDLRISGLDIDTEHRKEALQSVLSSFGVALVDGELQVTATESTLTQKKHDLIQATLAVGSLVHLARPTVLTLFKEDVARYLKEREVRFVPDVRLTGESGLHHPFDFVIPRSTNKPERYIQAISEPSRENIVRVMFAWQDVRKVREPDARGYVVLNDEGRRVNPDYLAALERYDVQVIRWTERDARISVLQDLSLHS